MARVSKDRIGEERMCDSGFLSKKLQPKEVSVNASAFRRFTSVRHVGLGGITEKIEFLRFLNEMLENI